MVSISLVLPHDLFKTQQLSDQTPSLTPAPPSFSVMNSMPDFSSGQQERPRQTEVHLKRLMLSSIHCHYVSLQGVMADVIEIGR